MRKTKPRRRFSVAYLEHSDVGMSIGAVATAVLSDVFKPLDVRLCIAVDLADEAGVLADAYGCVGR